MVLGTARRIKPLLASLAGSFASGQGFAQYAAPAVAVAKPGGLFGGSKRITVPLSEPLPGVHLPAFVNPQAPELQVGSIDGIKAATINAPGPNATIAVFVGAGSANETPETAGAAKLLEYLAFKATFNRTTFRLTRELEKYGAVTSAHAGRESIAYVIEATKLEVPAVTEILLDSVLNARLNDWEIADLLGKVEEDAAAAAAHPSTVASELLHRAAFSGGLSNALVPDAADVAALSADALAAFTRANFKASNIVIAAAGVELAQLQQVAAPLLGPATSVAPTVASSYTGGTLNALVPGVAPTVGIAFEAKGGFSDVKATATAAVVKALLNELREPLPWMGKEAAAGLTGLSPIANLYKTTGLVGLLATTTPGGAAKALGVLSDKLAALTKAPSDGALAAAKAVALGGYQSAIATKTAVVQDIGLQLLARGKFSSSEYAAAVTGLTGADVAKFVADALKTPPTVVAAGALRDIPKYDAVAKRFS